ncbi:MAG TPA: hypothetical protein VHB79_25985 [Polyangiaceae bacterium]|nr:hypothetical protein [Polyangiaceae bacterium]
MTRAEAATVQAGAVSTSAGLALGIASAVPASLPGLLRVWADTPSPLAALALVASTSLLIAPTGLWLRRAFVQGFPPTDQALACGVSLSALPLALFGGVLKSTTHHRPLGGATFAVAALCLLASCVGLAFRVLGATGHGAVKSAWRNLFTLGCGLSLASALLLGLSGAARPSLVDFLALAAGVAVAGLVRIPGWLARSKLPVVLLGWVGLLTCAVVSLQRPELVRSLTTQAPVSFAALSWLGGGF